MRLLMFHLVRSKEVVTRVVNQLDANVFNRAGEKAYMIIWAWSRWHYLQCDQLIPRSVMITEIAARLAAYPGWMDDLEQQQMWQLVEEIYARPESDISAEYGVMLAQELLNERMVKEAAASIQTAQDTRALMDTMEQLSHTVSNTRLTSVLPIKTLYQAGQNVKFPDEIRIATGVPFFDQLIGGGTKPGDLIGMIAPTSGGKTTLGVQLQCEVARTGRYVAYFTYEGNYHPEISRRSYGYAGHIPRNIMQNVRDLDGIPAEHRTRLDEYLARFGKYIIPFDMVEGGNTPIGRGGVPEIRAALSHFNGTPDEDGNPRHIDLVVIDQFLPLATRFNETRGADPSKLMHVMRDQILDLNNMAEIKDLNCAVVLLHQKRTVEQGVSPMKKSGKGEAAEYRAFEQFQDCCIAFGTKDEKTDCFWVTGIKGRDARTDEHLVAQMDGEYYRIIHQPGRWQPGRYRFLEAGATRQPETIQSEAEVDRPAGALQGARTQSDYDRDDMDAAM
jgi:RecA/RadA recombinase